ncbi:hypothetical protein ES707_12302 [subsurface metagenome]
MRVKANVLNDILDLRGMTQKDLADKLSIDESYISQLIHGVRRPTELMMMRIAKALRIKPFTLFDADGHFEVFNDLAYIKFKKQDRGLDAKTKVPACVVDYRHKGSNEFFHVVALDDEVKKPLRLIKNFDAVQDFNVRYYDAE